MYIMCICKLLLYLLPGGIIHGYMRVQSWMKFSTGWKASNYEKLHDKRHFICMMPGGSCSVVYISTRGYI